MNRTVKSLVAGALMLPALSFAEGLSYSYVEASYQQVDFDDLDADGDGYGLNGSLALAPNWHTFVGYATADIEGVDLNTWNLGLGYNHSLNAKADFIARVSYETLELDAGAVDVDDSGYGIALALRSEVVDNLELEGGIKYTDIGDFEDDTFLQAAGRYFFTPAFSAGLNVDVSDDITRWGAAFRFNFK